MLLFKRRLMNGNISFIPMMVPNVTFLGYTDSEPGRCRFPAGVIRCHF